MSKRRVLVIATTFPRWNGDSEPRFILDFAKSLLPYADVTVLVPSSPGALDKEVMEGVKVERFHYFPVHEKETLTAPGAMVSRIKEDKKRGLLLPFFYKAFIREIQNRIGTFDVLHANWVIPGGYVAYQALKMTNVPYVITCHGSDINSLNNSVFINMKKKALANAWGVTTVSSDLMSNTLKLYPHRKNAVISMGVDVSKFGEQHRKDNYFKQNGKKVALFVGRLVGVKGTEYAIRAMEHIPNTRLVIVGDGELKKELKKLASWLKDKLAAVNSDIVFAGAKTHDKLKTIYASADVLVMPSVTAEAKEGFGIVLLEAASSKLPIVASNSGGIPTLIKDGENGLLTEERDVEGIAEAINKVFNDSALRDKLTENAYKTALEYDYSVIGRKYAEFMRLV